MENKKESTIEKRKNQDKELLIEQLKKTPIVQVACEKTSIGRQSYYRWRKEDEEFKKATDAALYEGCLLVNDLAESQLISAIKDRNLGAISMWLKTHHENYSPKVEINGKMQIENTSLTAEQQDLITNALKLVGIDKSL
jgi:hypothetical protein